MLNKIPPIDDATSEDAALENSESRMLRALEAMSSHAQARPTGDPAPPREVNFAARRGPGREPAGRDQAGRDQFGREGFRPDGPSHGASKPRHRFVRDGEVTVVHMQTARPRDAAPPSGRTDTDWARLQGQSEEMRLKLEQVERTRAEALAQLRSVSTQLANAEIARVDAEKLAQTRAQEITVLQAELARARLVAAPIPIDAPIGGGSGAPAGVPLAVTAEPRRGPGRPRRQPQAEAVDPEPVQWWLMPPKPRRR